MWGEEGGQQGLSSRIRVPGSLMPAVLSPASECKGLSIHPRACRWLFTEEFAVLPSSGVSMASKMTSKNTSIFLGKHSNLSKFPESTLCSHHPAGALPQPDFTEERSPVS